MEDKREVSMDRVEKFKREKNIKFYFETSAKTGENIENLFIIASKVLYHTFKDKVAEMVSRHVINILFSLLLNFLIDLIDMSIEGGSNEQEKGEEA